MSPPTSTRVIINANPPTAELKPDTFAIETRDIPELKYGEVLLKTVAFGNEPAMRGWIDPSKKEERMYAPLVKKGEMVRAPIIGGVVASRSDKWKEGTRVTAMLGWTEYGVVKDSAITGTAASIEGQSEWISLGALGLTGLTAWAGVFEECKLKPEHVVLVSGAAGAVGNAVVQIAKKVVGCKRVVGVAGGKEKCDWVKSLGADKCLDYKSKTFAEDLKGALPDYADVFFDNVGGPVLDAALGVVKRYGFVSVCGAIAGYHGEQQVLKNWFEVIANRINIRGMILNDHAATIPRGRAELEQWIRDGRLIVGDGETVVDTNFEDVPETWKGLFTGKNTGKLVTKLV